MKLVEAAPKIQEEVVVGKLDVLAIFSATVKKRVNKSGKMAVAGCKVCYVTNMLEGCHILQKLASQLAGSVLLAEGPTKMSATGIALS